MISLLRGIFMPDDSLEPADRTVLAVCEIVAFALGWNGVDRLLAGRPLLVSPILISTILISYGGFKWPQIKLKIGSRLASAVERTVGSRQHRLAIYIAATMLALTSISYTIYNHSHKLSAAPITSSEISEGPATSQVEAHTVTVIDENGTSLKGAEIYFVRRNGVHSSRAVSGNEGIAEVATLGETVSVFCAIDGFFSYYQKDYTPGTPLEIKLKKSPHGGSVIFADGIGYIPALSGRLNLILDAESRSYLYAENIAINGGKAQPATFVLNTPLTLEDLDGHKVEIKIVSIIGSSSLIDYRRL